MRSEFYYETTYANNGFSVVTPERFHMAHMFAVGYNYNILTITTFFDRNRKNSEKTTDIQNGE